MKYLIIRKDQVIIDQTYPGSGFQPRHFISRLKAAPTFKIIDGLFQAATVGCPNQQIPSQGPHPNWNVGILEYWNHVIWDNGMVGLENQNEYNWIDFLVTVAYLLGQKQKMNV